MGGAPEQIERGSVNADEIKSALEKVRARPQVQAGAERGSRSGCPSLPDVSNTKGLRVYLPQLPNIPAKRAYVERRGRIKGMRMPTMKPKADQAVSSFAAPALVVAAQFLRKWTALNRLWPSFSWPLDWCSSPKFTRACEPWTWGQKKTSGLASVGWDSKILLLLCLLDLVVRMDASIVPPLSLALVPLTACHPWDRTLSQDLICQPDYIINLEEP